MAEDSADAEGGGRSTVVECRAVIPFDAAAAAQARNGGSRSSASEETTGIGTNNSNNDSSHASDTGGEWEIGTRKANHGFVGLSNQGATCYMNSLLQTLYMTPEFRAALYRWKCEKEEDDDCIPLQLQRLFGLLQLSTRGAVETNALTKSFGWTSSDGFQQHDVQELCKVLFDAFEREVKDTPQSTLVNDLYQGTMTNYVRCKECGKESQNPDTFLELSLVMRPFGSKTVMSSVLESLDYCLKPETLDGDNQYFCDNCEKKVDAIKGCKFSKLPYLLCLQLKRFDYDFTSFTRIKLNDEMRFPLIIDMNPYMKPSSSSSSTAANGSVVDEEAKDSPSSDDHVMAPTVGEPEGKSCEEPGSTTVATSTTAEKPVPDLVDVEGIKCPEQTEEEEVAAMGDEERSFHQEWDGVKLIEEKGPNVYELYGVLIHSGSALGGHYYAYIRSLEDGQWYNFNDSTVTRIDVATVKRAWGGPWASGCGGGGGGAAKRPYYKGMGYSGANAYMLMYRRIDPARNAKFPMGVELPEHVKEGVRKDEERAAKEREEHDNRMNAISVKVITLSMPEGTMISVSKKDTLAQAREKVWKTLNLEGVIPLDCLRLREFNDGVYTSLVKEEPLKDDDVTIENLGITHYRRLFAETRKPDEGWPTMKETDLPLHVRKYDAETDKLEPQTLVFIGRNRTVGDLRRRLADTHSVPLSRVRVGVEKAGDCWNKKIETLKEDGARLIDDCGLTQNHKVYLSIAREEEEGKGQEEEGELREDPLEVALNREANSWTVKVSFMEKDSDELPPADRAVDMKVDRRAKIVTLRDVVAKEFNLPDDGFRLLVKKHYNMSEIKGIDTIISKCNPAIFHGSAIYVVPGTPLRDGQHIFKLMELKTRYRAGVARSPHVVRCAKCADQQQEREGQEEGKKRSEGGEGHKEEKPYLEGDVGVKDGEQREAATPSPPPVTSSPSPPPPPTEGEEDTFEATKEGDGVASSSSSGSGSSSSSSFSPSHPSSEFGMIQVECMPVGEDYEERLSVVVDTTMNIADVRIKVAEELKKQGLMPDSASPDCVRLRDKMQNRAGKIFRDADEVRNIMSSRLEDTKELALQILDAPERLHEQKTTETVIVVQWFCRRCWALGIRYEFAMSNIDSLKVAADKLADQLAVEPGNLRLLNIVYATSLKLSDLGKNMPLPGKPWIDPHRPTPYISDGEILVCQDSTEPLRTLTEAELDSIKYEADADASRNAQRYTWNQGSSATASSTSTSYSWKRPAEKGVKIRTKEERMKEAEKQQQDAEEERERGTAVAAATAAGGAGRRDAVMAIDPSVGLAKPKVVVEERVVPHTGGPIFSLFDEIDGGEERDERCTSSGGSSTMESARESAEGMGL